VKWQGWGTALKPAFEPIVVARKPLIGTVAANVLAHGTGALNVDGCRIAHTGAENMEATQAPSKSTFSAAASDWTTPTYKEGGRWPANVILDESQAEALDRQSGVTSSPTKVTRGPDRNPSSFGLRTEAEVADCYGDTGGASRFFYTAKADATERPRVDGVAHPTVKPLDLMRYLVRLVTPPGGVVLEPFAGSGTTAEACIVEGFRCIAIEREADYLPLILQRITKPIEVTLL
jgi:site-specific DNA-methyltransferase (adenine-specific)